MNTVNQLISALGESAPPSAKLRIVDENGDKKVITAVTYHPAEGENPHWVSIDVEAEPAE